MIVRLLGCITVAALWQTPRQADAQQLKGDADAVATARRMIEEMGGASTWSAARLIYAQEPAPLSVAKPPTLREGTITTDDGLRLYYREVGSGSDVVMIPLAVWLSPHFDALATPNRRIIYYDPRGRGRSQTGDLSKVSLDRATRDLEALRQTLGIERMTLVGWSGYGMEMAVYALAHPNRVTKLVQLNPVPPRQEPYMAARTAGMRERVDGAAWTKYQALAKDKADPAAVCGEYNRAMAPAFFAKPEAATEPIDRLCQLENEWPDRQQRFFGAFMPSIATLDLRSRLGELKMPRLVIYGDRDLIALEGVREWLSDGGKATLVVLEGADHGSFLDDPAGVIAAIDRFVGVAPPDL